MRATSVNDVAAIIRGRRRDLRLTQSALAGMVGVSRKWISEVENGKATAELGLVMRSLDALGLELDLVDGGRPGAEPAGVDLDRIIAEHRRHG